MRIGIYIPSDIIPSEGGAFGYYHQLLKELLSRETQHQFVLLCGNADTTFLKKNNISSQKIPLINISAKSDGILFFLKLGERFSRRTYCKQIENYFSNRIANRYAQILTSKGIQFIYYMVIGEYLTLDIPFLANVWDMGHRNVNFFPEVSAKGEFEKRERRYNKILPRAALIATESEAGKKDIEFYFRIKQEKIIVLPLFPGNVVNVNVTQEEQNQWMNEKGLVSKCFLFYPAQFWAHKNHINLLKAIALLKKQYKIEVPLVLTGSDKGNFSYVKNKIAEYNLQKQVHYLGFVSEKEMRILYENAMALVMPTFLGPTTMPIIEAIAIGCPVICSDFEGHRAQLEDAALYFSPDDHNNISEKIQSLIINPELRSDLIRKGKQLHESGKNSVKKSVDVLLKSFHDFEIRRECWQ